ncbi:MAG: hypothetical protein HY241_04495 [Actinobacteria bacterium]|nr:hypothetical protein [Actinomycetota bacterium]
MRLGRGFVVAVVASGVGALVVVVPGGLPAVAGVTSSAATAPAPDGEAAALVAARASGSRVEVASERSEVQQVFANPDGTFTAEVAASPVRVGDTATYPEVWPGVDLRVRAEVAGFAQELVVKTRAAAGNPALTTVHLTVGGPGLVVRQEPSGELSAVDSGGGVVFRSPAAMMWDSPTPTAAGVLVSEGDPDPAVAGVDEARVGVAVVPGGVDLVPDAGMLGDPGTVFPVVVDPSWTASGPAWTEVNAYDPNSATWRTADGTLAVGYQNYSSPYSLVRMLTCRVLSHCSRPG